MQAWVHYGFHLLLPGIVAWFFFRSSWKKAWLIMLATMIVDLDHLLACSHSFPFALDQAWLGLSHLLSCDQIFIPDRCSIGYHPLHSYPLILLYVLFFCFSKTRLVALGLLLHMATDAQDCLWM